MPLHPLLQDLLAQAEQRPQPTSITEARANVRALVARVPRTPVTIGVVRDLRIALPGRDLPARLYLPGGPDPAPALTMYFHGGGWSLCDLDTHDGHCARLCAESGTAVLSLDYRLAPEHPYPAAHDDCLAATRWALEAAQADTLGVTAGRFLLCGDSAGGNLAASVAHALRDAAGPQPLGQALIYPVLQHVSTPPASYARLGQGYGLTLQQGHQQWRMYLPRPDRGVPATAAPLRDNCFEGLPPTLVLTAEYDMLCDEGADYVRRLERAGVPATLLHVEGMNHGFMVLEALLPEAADAFRSVGAWLRQHSETSVRSA